MGAKTSSSSARWGSPRAAKRYSECAPAADTGYHLYPDMDYIELVDPETGEPVGEGEDGELVYTCLDGRGTCVVRFRTGDYVKGGIVYEPCPSCGRTVPRLGSDITRSGKVKGFSLTKLKGTLVDQGAFFSVLDEHPDVREWQVEIGKAGGDPLRGRRVDVYAALAEGADEEAVRAEDRLGASCSRPRSSPTAIEFLSIERAGGAAAGSRAA